MSANVETMMYNAQNGIPWHKSGTPVDGLVTAQEALTAASLDWKVDKVPVYTPWGIEVPDKYIVIRDTDRSPLGIVGKKYRPVQNVEAFDFMDTLLQSGEAHYETAGALGHGERIWILARLPGAVEPVTGDPIERYITLYNSHDGSKALGVFMTPIRVVCQNTLNAAIRQTPGVYQIRHTANYRSKMNEARELLASTDEYFKAFTEQMAALARVPADFATAKAFVNAILPEPVTEQEGRMESWRDKQNAVFGLIETGMGTELPGVRGTAYGLYQAAVEYADHHLSLRTKSLDDQQALQKKAESTLFGGTVQKFKQKALDAAFALA